MKRYIKVFVDPLHALQYKAGIEFVDDPFFKVHEPKKDGPTRWVLVIDDHTDDDEEEGIIEIMNPETVGAREKHVSRPSMPEPVSPPSVAIDDDAVRSATTIGQCACVPCRLGSGECVSKAKRTAV